MKREHIILVFLALFAGLVTFSPAVSPKFGDIPNPNGMNYGWDGTNNVARSMAVDADGNAQIELNNASTTPANVVLRDGTSGAQIGTTTKPLTVTGDVTGSVSVTNATSSPVNTILRDANGTQIGSTSNPITVTGAITAAVTLPAASATESAPSDALPVMLYANDNSALQRLFTAIVQGDGVNGNNMLPGANYVYNGSSFDREQVKYNRIQSSTSAKSDSIATDAATLISSIASITPPCSVQISCPAGQLWYAPGLATTTLSSMQYHVLDEFQSVVFNVSTSTWDCSVAGVSAVSSCSVTVHSLVQ